MSKYPPGFISFTSTRLIYFAVYPTFRGHPILGNAECGPTTVLALTGHESWWRLLLCTLLEALHGPLQWVTSSRLDLLGYPGPEYSNPAKADQTAHLRMCNYRDCPLYE